MSLLTISKLSAQEKDSVITLPTVTVTSGAKVTKEVDKAFKTTFPGAENLKWYNLNKDYLAKFIQKDMSHNTLFTKRGYMKYDISYGYENNLPEDIKTKVKSSYDSYKITRVANVKADDRNVWVINLESLNAYILVRIENDEMEEVEKFNKSE